MLVGISNNKSLKYRNKSIKNNLKEKMSNIKQVISVYNKPYKITKQIYKSIIPLSVYQTWSSHLLPPLMQHNMEIMKKTHPRFTFYLFDDNQCAEFIKNNFDIKVYNAYNKLIPGAYKADLWRYCILYKYGGIYLDIKYFPVNGFRLIELTENEHWVRDRPKPLSIYNALMVCQAGNVILRKAIEQVVKNVENNFYGESPLEPTGPTLLGNIILRDKHLINLDMKHYSEGSNIIYKNTMIFRIYEGYEEDRKKTLNIIKKGYYADLWHSKSIYR